MKTFKALQEQLQEKRVTVDIDYVEVPEKEKAAEMKFRKKNRVKVKVTGDSSADVSGERKDVYAWMKHAGFFDGLDDEEIEQMHPELF